jgi:hypothetical protein
MDTGNASSFYYAVEAVVLAFGAVVAVALERFYKDPKVVKAQRFEHSPGHEVFYWSVLTVLVSLGIRFLIGSTVHLHGTITENRGPVHDLLWDILWLFVFGSFIVRAALADDDCEFAKWLRWFSGAGVFWSLIAIVRNPGGTLTYRLALGWLIINGAQFAATFLVSGNVRPGSNEQVLRMLTLAVIFALLFIVDLCNILDGSLWKHIVAMLHCPAAVMHSVPTPINNADKAEWHFVISGDLRNCGDLIMPAVAQGAGRDHAAFYTWVICGPYTNMTATSRLEEVWTSTITEGCTSNRRYQSC